MNKYRLDTPENQQFMKEIGEGILDFGRRFPSPGGGSYYLGDDGTPWTERNRETWITSRMCHVYSIGHMLGYPGCSELAAQALKGLKGELHDTANGGWYAGLTAEGEPLPDKQCYAHAFVILASSSAMLAGIEGAKELLDEALELYDLRFWNEAEGLSCDTWNTEFTVLDPYRGLNANMHTVEAFLAAADALHDEKYRIRAGRIIDHVISWAENSEYRIPEHFASDWTPEPEFNREKPDDPFKPYGATPGHGLEWARLITQWALSTYKIADQSEDSVAALASKKRAAYYLHAAEELFDRAVTDAWNADGAPGIVYTTDWTGKPVIHDRMHWTLAEAINTAAVLCRAVKYFEPEKAEGYAAYFETFMQYLDEIVLDHTYGSWYHQLDEHNKLKGTVWPGKSDLYHAFQAMQIPYLPTDISIAAAVYRNRLSE